MKDKVEQDLEKLSKTKPNKKLKDNLKKIDNAKDVVKKNKLKDLSKQAFRFWIYIFKDGRKIKDFGVNEEEYGDVKLLVRREEIKGETKIVFRELYPEPKHDLKTIQNNKKQIAKELNKLKQIEKELEENMFSAKPKEFNYDITDVRISIEEKEIMLQSIKYGVTHRYFHDIRGDKIPAIFYEMENSSLKLIKYVKENNTLTEASENKKIESAESKRQIDHQLKKKSDKDWQRIAITALWIFLLAIATYGIWELMNYNKDREMQFATENLDHIYERQVKLYDDVIKTIKETNVKNSELENNILTNNNEILKQCIIPQNQAPTSS